MDINSTLVNQKLYYKDICTDSARQYLRGGKASPVIYFLN